MRDSQKLYQNQALAATVSLFQRGMSLNEGPYFHRGMSLSGQLAGLSQGMIVTPDPARLRTIEQVEVFLQGP